MVADTHTPNINLTKIAANRENWSAAANRNASIIDAMFGTYFDITNIRGVWANSTTYTASDVVIDTVTGTLWTCRVDHVSAAVPTIFSADRTAHSTYWTVIDTAPLYRGAWATAISYSNNDFVLLSNIYYVCRTNHTSGTFATDLAAGKWEVLLDMSTAVSSAAAAAVSAAAAAVSAADALTSAGVASTQATNAAASAVAAAASAVDATNNGAAQVVLAAAQVTLATTQATNAATSASTATTQASNASTSASNAATSETNAGTSATNAATSETNAATSETNAAAEVVLAAAQVTLATAQAGVARGFSMAAQATLASMVSQCYAVLQQLNQVLASGVASFNGRTGVVTFTNADTQGLDDQIIIRSQVFG